jgi:hypothetical protein
MIRKGKGKLQGTYESPSTQLFVLSDDLHGSMFQPPGGHLQDIKIH